MRLALLDLGTAALRFEVYDVNLKAYLSHSSTKQTRRIYQERLMPRLGRGLYKSGTLDASGMAETREFFARIPQLCAEQRVEKVRIGATSALREAKNGPAFVRELEALCQNEIELLTGEREATLIAKGILSHESQLDEELLFVDIGGGSTEISHFSEGEIRYSESIQLGAIRENQNFLHCKVDDKQPPKPSAIAELRIHAQHVLQARLPKQQIEKILGTSGTIRTLCKLLPSNRRDQHLLYSDELRALVERLSEANFSERLEIEGLESNRADIIVAGAIVFEEILRFFSTRCVQVSTYSLRHGLLDETLESLLQERNSP